MLQAVVGSLAVHTYTTCDILLCSFLRLAAGVYSGMSGAECLFSVQWSEVGEFRVIGHTVSERAKMGEFTSGHIVWQ